MPRRRRCSIYDLSVVADGGGLVDQLHSLTCVHVFSEHCWKYSAGYSPRVPLQLEPPRSVTVRTSPPSPTTSSTTSSTSQQAMAALLADRGVKWVALGWGAFVAENVILSENRQSIVELAGEQGYVRLYGSLSTLCLTSTAYGYLRHARAQGPRLFPALAGPSIPRNALAFALQAVGFAGLSQFMPPIVPPPETSTGVAPAPPPLPPLPEKPISGTQ
eukprot:1190863-Prorocentrum_minimum.AAC.3